LPIELIIDRVDRSLIKVIPKHDKLGSSSFIQWISNSEPESSESRSITDRATTAPWMRGGGGGDWSRFSHHRTSDVLSAVLGCDRR